MSFKSLDEDVIYKSHNPLDPRLSMFLSQDPQTANVHILGYPDDEGIKLNGGRSGACEAPDQIRRIFYKMTPGPLLKSGIKLWDAGNLSIHPTLAQRHELAYQKVRDSLEKKKFVLTLGGGHDYGYPDAKGFLEVFKKSKKKPVVINFDAHMDVRPLHQGLTSGTPFYRLLNEYSDQLHFFEVGIQHHCNSKEHIQWCEKKKGKILYQSDIEKKGLLPVLKKALAKFKNHPTFLSVDIDGFSSAVAPGCSQSWPIGFDPREFFLSLDYLFKQLDVKNLGIYEVSPPLDVGPLTSRLAALILYRSLIAKG